MQNKQKLPTINIKGSEYVQVKDRVLYFNSQNPEGCIVTKLLSNTDSEHIIIRAEIYPEGLKESSRKFTGHAQETIGEGYINKTSALENAETSAVGRGLAMMGIGVIDSIASVDEINKAGNNQYAPKKIPPKTTGKKAEIKKLCDDLDPLLKKDEYAKYIKDNTKLDASDEKNFDEIIDRLKVLKKERITNTED